jgi:hypothetical protein
MSGRARPPRALRRAAHAAAPPHSPPLTLRSGRARLLAAFLARLPSHARKTHGDSAGLVHAEDQTVAGACSHVFKERGGDTAASEARVSGDFRLVFVSFSHVKKGRGLVRCARFVFDNLQRLHATPQSLKGVMSIAVEKRVLTADNLSGRILCIFIHEVKSFCVPSGGNS